MTANPIKERQDSYFKTFRSYEHRLKDIYRGMDDQYGKVSSDYGFDCKGCKESCCETRFFHHTWIEFFYLIQGFRSLVEKEQQEIRHTAMAVCETYRRAEIINTSMRMMCPLNFDGLCRIYDYRPMICRLHGIPHELHKPGRQTIYGPGCGFFTRRFGDLPYIPFDRTPFYQEMAVLEQAFRKAIGKNEKIKMTIAEMLLKF